MFGVVLLCGLCSLLFLRSLCTVPCCWVSYARLCDISCVSVCVCVCVRAFSPSFAVWVMVVRLTMHPLLVDTVLGPVNECVGVNVFVLLAAVVVLCWLLICAERR